MIRKRLRPLAAVPALILMACSAGDSPPPGATTETHAPTAGSPTVLLSPTAPSVPPTWRDALHERVLTELAVFTDWLARYRVRGFVGEVGWPDDTRHDAENWNALAEEWFRRADAHQLWVTTWATGEWWHGDYPLAAYEDRDGGGGVEAADTQARVIERHPSTPDRLRGINVAGAEFGAPVIERTSGFSNANPGTPERDYHYDSAATFEFLAARGIELVRIPFRWERLQPRPGRALDDAELGRLRRQVRRAGAAGLRVILDMHNYGGYFLFDGSQGVRRPIGSRPVLISAFADGWRRISRVFQREPGVVGYGLMNEPVELEPVGDMTPAQVWFRASQAAVSAIRANGDRTLILVSGYQWSGVQQWTRWQPRPWIRDPAGNVRYEAHHYWDCDHSGTYAMTYEQEVSAVDAGHCGG